MLTRKVVSGGEEEAFFNALLFFLGLTSLGEFDVGVEFFLFSIVEDKSGESVVEVGIGVVFRLLLEEEEELAVIFLLNGVEER